MPHPLITSVTPTHAVEGGRCVLRGTFDALTLPPAVTLGGVPARVAASSGSRLVVVVPGEVDGGPVSIGIADVDTGVGITVGYVWATGLHQVDSPVFGPDGHLFLTYSGPRGQESPVSVFRVSRQGTREPYSTGIVNATSTTVGPEGALYVSSRFEGTVYRVEPDGSREVVARDLGVACGLAFDAEGVLHVGDRSGSVFRVRDGRPERFATLPASVAAFHLAMGPQGDLFVTGPTLATRDPVYRITPDGTVTQLPWMFGRPQGLGFDRGGVLHVVEALAGASGVYRLVDGRPPELVVSGPSLIGVAFGPAGQMVVCSNDTAYWFD